MTVKIHGTGTIEGVVAGGLPDGSIVDADIAAIAASKLTGTIADARFPATLPAVSGTNLTNLPASGKVLQVVSDSAANSATFGGPTSFIATGLPITITPSSTSSKIFVMFNSGNCYQDSANLNFYAHATIYRGSSNLFGSTGCSGAYFSSVSYNDIGFSFNGSVLDAPATNSAITYEVYWKSSTSSAALHWSLTGVASITAMEIAA